MFLVLTFTFSRLQNWRKKGETGLPRGEFGAMAPVGGGGSEGRGRRMNMVQIMYKHAGNCKNHIC
jgi:hypothetical protein